MNCHKGAGQSRDFLGHKREKGGGRREVSVVISQYKHGGGKRVLISQMEGVTRRWRSEGGELFWQGRETDAHKQRGIKTEKGGIRFPDAKIRKREKERPGFSNCKRNKGAGI